MYMARLTINCKESLEKTVGKHGTGGIVYVPKGWIGRKVVVVLEGE
jgi:putative transposon-encoded protein